jgi:hypothetical protein
MLAQIANKMGLQKEKKKKKLNFLFADKPSRPYHTIFQGREHTS